MGDAPRSRWTDRDDVPRGADYDRRFEVLAASGADVHGEATLVAALAPGPRILDAGCGTGRVAIELARRDFEVTGLDIDAAMLRSARAKAPDLPWIEGDLATADAGGPFDAIVLAGNVLIFVAPGSEPAVVARCAHQLRPGGLLVSGFQVQPGGYDPDQLDDHALAAGLERVDRWSTWDRAPWSADHGYQVSVHRRPA